MLAGNSHPGALAAAVALGIFIGCSPFYGLQTLLVLGLSALFRLNPLAAALGSQVSFPPLGIAIIGTEVALGEWLRFGIWAVPVAPSARDLPAWLFAHALLSWAIGSVLLGGVLAALGGGLAFGVFAALKARRRSKAAPASPLDTSDRRA